MEAREREGEGEGLPASCLHPLTDVKVLDKTPRPGTLDRTVSETRLSAVAASGNYFTMDFFNRYSAYSAR